MGKERLSFLCGGVCVEIFFLHTQNTFVNKHVPLHTIITTNNNSNSNNK